MLVMSRFHEESDSQQQKELPFSESSAQAASRGEQRMEQHSSRVLPHGVPSFQYDFRLEDEEVPSLKAGRGEPFEFGLPSTHPEHARALVSSHFPCQHPYQPPALQIPTQAYPQDPSPSYVHSATSDAPYSAFPQSHGSRSLSPGDNPVWTDDSSPSVGHQSQSPFETLPFSKTSEASHSPSITLVPSSSGRQTNHQSSTSRVPSSRSQSHENNLELPLVKLGPNGLAEDQPPTAQGRMRTRVYVACLQCRSRKIRCDGGKPKCQKCSRRSSECSYDTAPKRRGPDKKPGARQRTSKKAKAAQEEAARKAEIEAGPNGSSVPEQLAPAHNEASGSRKRARRSDSNGAIHLTTPSASRTETSASTSTPSSVELSQHALPAEDSNISLGLTSIPPLADLIATSHIEKADARLVDDPHFSLTPLSFDYDPPETNHASSSLPLSAQSNNDFMTNTLGTWYPDFTSAHITSVNEEDNEVDNEVSKRKWYQYEIGSEPSLDFTRKTWWDNLLSVYAPGSDRAVTARLIHSDLQRLFKTSNYFVSFFNVPLFFSIFCNPLERDRMQPSLVIAALAMSNFLQSSELQGGNAGRSRSIWLRDLAQASLEASFNARWVDPTLAQAAWLLAMFETCAHPYHTTERSCSAMVMMDSIIRGLGLTAIDADHPNVSKFAQRGVPIVPIAENARVSRQNGCSCRSLTLGSVSRSSHEHTPLWTATAAWNPDWNIAEIRKEESRRLCWSALQLAAGHTSHAAAFSTASFDYYCIQPSNYALLFPGESLLDSPVFTSSHSPKDSIWALYSRAMLLWNSCLRMRSANVSSDEKAAFAFHAWIESTAIEEALDAHTCGCDQAFLFQGKEYLFMTRMCISYEFRRYIPHPESGVNNLFNRKKAETWLVNQANIAKRIMQGLHTVTGHRNNILAQRPFFIWWFMSQAARALSLWECDNTLIVALEVCKAYYPAMDYLACLWPCESQRIKYRKLHVRIVEACQTAGIPPPPPPNFQLLAPGSPPVNIV
ncbi:hypothetical protein M422DRAFT_222008 [Sphaerobolus stellatus SS14]|nr:hypothetical protein M422DRAFT_222008 [Sphaerobolus stellatus SS14]